MLKNIQTMWLALSVGKRAALVFGCVVLLTVLVWLFYLMLHDDKEVLFSDLEARDQAAIVSQLDKLKIPYTISDDGRSILVAHDSVHRTRLKVMSEGVDIKGTVGFEVFNSSDYGASEFAQKINYQRAVQGELSRTILSVEGVKYARVLLAMPDGSYLRRKDAKPVKASVALTLKDGVQLSAEQVTGIQRLVASSVQDLEPSLVVVTDQKGLTLSKSSLGEDKDSSSGKLEVKRQADQYLTRKLSEMLDRALGAGQAVVSVDVTLNHDQITQSREELLGASADGRDVQGVVLRKRSASSLQASPTAHGEGAARSADTSGGRSESLDVEYGYGKHVEHVVGSPGNIKRISVGVVLTAPMDAARIDKIREIVSMAVGYNPQRGDGISVQSLAPAAGTLQMTDAIKSAQTDSAPIEVDAATSRQNPDVVIHDAFLYALLVILGLLVAGTLVFSKGRLSATERQALLKDMQAWLSKDASANEAAGGKA